MSAPGRTHERPGGTGHGAADAPSPWVLRHLPLVATGGAVLDLAAGHGRHARLIAGSGHAVLALDRDAGALAALRLQAGVTALEADLEGGPWPLPGRFFAGIVVTNYLWRPLLGHLTAALAPAGILIYETFRVGNEVLGKPSNPDFLLREGELLELARAAGLAVVAFESGQVTHPRPAVIERICARRAAPGAPPAALPASSAGGYTR